MSGKTAIQFQAASRSSAKNAQTIKLVLGDDHSGFLTALRAQSGIQSSATGTCTDRKIVRSMVAAGPGKMLAFKEGTIEKLGVSTRAIRQLIAIVLPGTFLTDFLSFCYRRAARGASWA